MGFNTGKVKKTKTVVVDEWGPVLDGPEASFSTGKIKKEPKATARVWSPHQKAIFEAGATLKDSLIIQALAGTGKTTTIVELVRYLKGKVLLCAFNKRIATELADRDSGAEVMTLHGLGYRLVGRSFPGTQVDNMRGLATALDSLKHVGGPISKNYQWMVKDTMSICKEIAPYIIVPQNSPATEDLGSAVAQVLTIGRGYGHLDRLDDRFAEPTAEAVLEGMRRSLKVCGTVDYSDMLFVPLHVIATQGEYDVVIVDEAQDMNAAQLYLAQQVLKKDGRLIVVGDQHQAIYGFRGADSGSMDRLQAKFKAKVLPLPVSYRCARAIIAEAQKFVPEIQPRPDAPNGTVEYLSYGRMVREAQAGSFILSRLNAPLLRLCLMFIKEGRPAVVEGRDIGKGLLNLISKMTFNKPVPVGQFLGALRVWKFKQIEMALSADDKEREQLVCDQTEALEILSEDCPNMDAVRRHIEALFDDTLGKSSKIVCSTVHKAKGLEAPRVFILCDTFKGSWDGGTGEEANLKYVAITRAQTTLSYVEHPNPPGKEYLPDSALARVSDREPTP